jgi:hypothetical protein
MLPAIGLRTLSGVILGLLQLLSWGRPSHKGENKYHLLGGLLLILFPVWETDIPSFREVEPTRLLSRSERLRLRHKLKSILAEKGRCDIVENLFKESVIDVIFPPGCKPSKHLTKTFRQFKITWLDIFKAERSDILKFLTRDHDRDQMCIVLEYWTSEARGINKKKDIGDIWNDQIVEDSTIGRIFTNLFLHHEPPSYKDA